eukprot:scaffold192938_cov34-Prasinocladus_malaysianus.AAC.2
MACMHACTAKLQTRAAATLNAEPFSGSENIAVWTLQRTIICHRVIPEKIINKLRRMLSSGKHACTAKYATHSTCWLCWGAMILLTRKGVFESQAELPRQSERGEAA